MPDDFAGNSLLQAREINGYGAERYHDYIGRQDLNDYYTFTLSGRSTLNLSLREMDANGNLELLNEQGRVIGASRNPHDRSEAIDTRLEAGTYYIRVYREQGNTDYQLRVTANLVPVQQYRFTYQYNGQDKRNDYYTGYVYALEGTYQVGQRYDYTGSRNEILKNGKYLITSVRRGGTASDLGKVFVDRYYDVDTSGDTFIPYNFSRGLASGLNYFGSEYDFVRQPNTTTTDFGRDRYELDVLPTVSVTATDSRAAEVVTGRTANPGQFRITRSGGLSRDLVVFYSMGGTATNGQDYRRASGRITFRAGQRSLNVDISALDDNRLEGNETVTLTLLNNSRYQVRTRSSNVTLQDNETELSVAPIVAIGTAPSVITGTIGASNTEDYYRFNLAANSYFNATLTNLTSDVDLALIRDLNNNGLVDSNEVIASSVRPSDFDEALNLANLEAGTYFVRVYQYSGTGNYTLRLSTSDPSNLLVDELELSTPDVSSPESLDDRNTSDIYRFAISEAGIFSATISGLTADADIRLIQDANNNGIIDAGEVLAESIEAGTTVDTLTRSLTAGTYFFQVYQFTDSTNYQLQTSLSPIDTAGNTLATARDISGGSTPLVVSEFVGRQDTDDYYRFTVGGIDILNVGLTGLTGEADLELFNDSGTLINTSRRSGVADETINQFLADGIYYLRVVAINSDTSYSLRLSNTLFETSPILATELDFGALGSSEIIQTGNISTALTNGNTTDVFRFSLSNTSNLNLRLTGLSSDLNVRLIRDNNNNGLVDDGEVLGLSTNDNTASELINLNLLAGQYFAQVYYQTGSSNSPFTLSLSAGASSGARQVFRGTLGADTFTLTPGYSQLAFLGNGNVDFGTGARDILDLSTITAATATLNLANLTNGGLLFDPGNGARLFDAITFNTGISIAFEGIEQIRFADQVFDLSITPNDPLFSQQWNLHMMGVHNAWRFTTGSNQVLLGIEDTGLGQTSTGNFHPDQRATTTISNNTPDEIARDDSSHGSAVQGIIAAATNNGIGMAGINWNSPIVNLDVLGGELNDFSLEDATRRMIEQATSQGQKVVINMSLGIPESFDINYHPDLAQLVANNPNVLLLIATGNSGQLGTRGLNSPAALAKTQNNVMAIGAAWGRSDRDNTTREPGTRIQYSWWGSQYGPGITVMGPSEVVSTRDTNTGTGISFDYFTGSGDRFNGTSAATPNVAGVASLVWSANPNLTAAQVRQILSETATDTGPSGYDELNGNGLVNAEAAVRRAIALARSNSSSST